MSPLELILAVIGLIALFRIASTLEDNSDAQREVSAALEALRIDISAGAE